MDPELFEEYKTEPLILGTAFSIEDDEYILDIYQPLATIVEHKLKQYPTTLSQDVALANNPLVSITSNIQACISIRIAEKSLLLELKSQLLDEIEQLNPRSKKQPLPPHHKKKHKKHHH